MIDRNTELAQALRITGTPGFVAGDQIFPGATDLVPERGAVFKGLPP
ncbi:hypothetical protein [Mesorhizobium sp. 2RAF45]